VTQSRGGFQLNGHYKRMEAVEDFQCLRMPKVMNSNEKKAWLTRMLDIRGCVRPEGCNNEKSRDRE
jgi:hypothetical protein